MNHLVDQYFDSLTDKRVAVLGIGVSNRPLIRMLLARGICVLACDKTPREKLDAEVLELEQAGAVLHVGEHYLDDVQADIVFRTPGMHPDIPALRRLREKGAELLMQHEVVRVNAENGSVRSVTVRCTDSGSPDFGKERTIECDFLVSSMAVKDLVQALPDVPEDILHIASELPYRDFITVGLLLDRLEIQNKTKTPTINNIVPDCWIYIQEREVKLGRLQIFNNWSPYMVDDNTKHVWVGLEYFCTEGDEMWNTPPEEFIDFASKELEQIGIIKRENIADSFTAKVKKAYPAYFGTYKEFGKVRGYLDSFDNLYCIGRNGQHRYNNMDHSMLTAMNAARSIISGTGDRESVWSVNTEKEYHEEAKEQKQ